MIETLGYLISSHVAYQAPLQRLLLSLPTARDAVAIVGGHVAYAERQIIVRQYEVPHNSYDYTALIDLVEHRDWYPARWSHVFLLHDTMELSPDSDRLIRQADPTLDAVAVWGGECNLGLYRVDYLLSRRDDLLALKDCTKLRAVEHEGFLWRTCPEDRRGTYPGGIDIDYAQPIYGGVERQKVTYTGVGIIKYKANWGQTWPPSVVTP